MKAHITSGSGFRGTLDYVTDKDQKNEKGEVERIGGSLAGATRDELAAEFGQLRDLRPDIGKPVWHSSLSLPPGEHLTSERWNEVCESYLKKMGMDPATTAWVAFKHNDRDHEHVHIVASRINWDATIWKDGREILRAIAATRALETEFGLMQTAGYTGPARVKNPRANEVNRFARTGEVPARMQIQNAIATVLEKGECTAPEFVAELGRLGVHAKANVVSTGKMSGFSFECDGAAFRGSHLGESFKWTELQKRGVTYDKDRDAESLGESARGTERNGSEVEAGSRDVGLAAVPGATPNAARETGAEARSVASPATLQPGKTQQPAAALGAAGASPNAGVRPGPSISKQPPAARGLRESDYAKRSVDAKAGQAHAPKVENQAQKLRTQRSRRSGWER